MSTVWARRALPSAAACGAVVLLTAGCAIDLSHLRPGGDEEPEEQEETVDASELAEPALASLAEWPAVRFEGRMADADGENPFDVQLMVSDGGTMSGSLDIDDSTAALLQVDGRLFVDADDVYWLSHDTYFTPDSDSYAEHQVRVHSDEFGLDFSQTLTPAALAETLSDQAPGAGEDAVEDEVDGTDAYRLPLDGGEMWVSAEEPHEVLRIQLTELTGEGGDAGLRTDLTFAQPEPGEIEEFYDAAIATVEDDLSSARDARLNFDWAGELDLSCQTGGACSVSGEVEETSGESGDATIRVRMDAVFENDELGELTCDDTGSLDTGGTVELSCGVDYDLAPSTSPQTYEVSSAAELSSRSIGGDARDETVASLEEQREATLERAGGADGGDTADDGAEDDEDDAEEEE
jgi:hypothetical protein